MDETASKIVARTSSSVLTRNTSLISGSSNRFLCLDVRLGSSAMDLLLICYLLGIGSTRERMIEVFLKQDFLIFSTFQLFLFLFLLKFSELSDTLQSISYLFLLVRWQ